MGGVDLKGAVRPNHKIGTGYFLFDRPLGFQALAALDGIPAPLAQTPGLRGGGTGHAEGRIEKRLRLGFKEQGDDDRAAGAARFAPSVRFGIPGGPDARMEDGFQIGAGGRQGEDLPGQLLPVQPPVRKQNSGAESLPNFRQGGLPRLNSLAGNVVAIHDRHAVLPEQQAGGGFAHGDSAGDAKKFHGGTGASPRPMKAETRRKGNWKNGPARKASEPVKITGANGGCDRSAPARWPHCW